MNIGQASEASGVSVKMIRHYESIGLITEADGPKELRARRRRQSANVQYSVMAKFFRIVALALLALMLPLQGVASVLSAQCMAIGHHPDAGAGHTHAEGAAADGHDHASHSHDHDDAAAQSDDGAQASHCGPCTACCASASIAGPAVVFAVPSSSNTEHLFSPFPPRGFEPQALDRPPLAL